MGYPTYVRRQTQQVEDEVDAQLTKWGVQDHPNGTGSHEDAVMAGRARANCHAQAAAGAVTWRDILTEEVCEALAESDPAKLRAELIQVAAVCVSWVEAIDRRE